MIKTIVVALVVWVMIAAGLAIVPALTEQTADAVSCKPKKDKDNVDAVIPEPSLTQVKQVCPPPSDIKCDEDKKPKDRLNAVMPEPSLTLVKKGCGDGGGGINVKCDGFKNNGDVCKPKKPKIDF